MDLAPQNADFKKVYAAARAIQEAPIMDEAVKKHTAGDLAGAIALYIKALNLNPADAHGWTNLAGAYQASEDFNRSKEAYQKAVDLDKKGESENWYFLGLLDENANQGAKALSDYQRYMVAQPRGTYAGQAQSRIADLRINPNKTQKIVTETQQKQIADTTAQEAAVMDEAVKKHTAGDLPGALTLYRKALALNPSDAHGWTNMAGAYQASEDFAQARDAYQKGLDLDNKGESENWYFLGMLDENANQGARALSDYQHYMMANPHGTYATQAQGRIADLRINPNKTEKIVTASEQKQSSEGQEAYANAVKLQQDNKLEEALAQYKKAIAAQPSESSFYYGMGTCYQAKGDFDLAMTNYRKAISLNPKEQSYKDALKQVAQAKAQPLVDAAVKKQTTKDAKGNYDISGAIVDYEAALRIDDDASTHLNLGTAYQGNNQLPKAIDQYKRAVQMDPKGTADGYYYLGTIYEQMNQASLAIPEYQRYLKIAPKGPNAADARSRLQNLQRRTASH